MNLFSEFRYRVSACARCKSLWGRNCVLCADCWAQLYDVQNVNLAQEYYSFRTYSLFTWSDEFDHLIRPLIYGLKGGFIREPWCVFATDFLFLRGQIHLERDAIIVLAPRKKLRDHGFYWAQAIASQTGFEIYDDLISTPFASQKSLGLVERQKRRYSSRSAISQDRPVIFADDTITSGATASAVYEALDFPPRFEVWTLVARPRFSAS